MTRRATRCPSPPPVAREDIPPRPYATAVDGEFTGNITIESMMNFMRRMSATGSGVISGRYRAVPPPRLHPILDFISPHRMGNAMDVYNSGPQSMKNDFYDALRYVVETESENRTVSNNYKYWFEKIFIAPTEGLRLPAIENIILEFKLPDEYLNNQSDVRIKLMTGGNIILAVHSAPPIFLNATTREVEGVIGNYTVHNGEPNEQED